MENSFLLPSLTDKDTITILKNRIINGTPFTLTRFGDGEIFILNRNASNEFLVKNLREWGYKYPEQIDDFYNDANKVLQNAFVKSDIIGIMNPNDKVTKKIGYNKKVWSLDNKTVESFGISPSDLKICNHMISRSPEVGSVKGFKDIIQGNGFHIITSHSESMKRKNLDELFEVNITYTDHPSNINFNNRDEFVDNFKNIKEQIVIMGVGLQKDYGVILRDKHNKISLDMGATMDAWSGVISRPWFRKGQLQDYLIIP